MKLKNLLGFLIVLGMVLFLFSTPTGQKYMKSISSNFLNILKVFPGFIEEKEISFLQINATLNKKAIYNRSFEIINSTFFAKGNCLGKIRLGEILRDTKNLTCEIIIDVNKAKIELDYKGRLFFEGNAKNIFIDKVEYKSFFPISIGFSILPTNLRFWIKDDLKLLSNGTINKIVKGKIDQTKFLNNEAFEILGFNGSLIIEKDELRIEGWANLVKGENFEFR